MTLLEKLRRNWKNVTPWLLGASLLVAGGTALAKKLATDDCCKPGASCCYPGSPCCKGHHEGVAQR